MSGPATKMHEALWEVATAHDVPMASVDVAVRDITPEQLAVMDAAAERSARPAAHADLAHGRLVLQLAIGPNLWTTVALAEEAEGALLDALLARAVQRRKEGGA